MAVTFEVKRVAIEISGCVAPVVSYAEAFASILKGLRYSGTVRHSNSFQLDIGFDSEFFSAMEQRPWKSQRHPAVDMEALGEQWGRQKADAMVEVEDLGVAVVEIEKANKKTLWFDFMKLWMFVESGQASVGIIVCPLNYAHRHGIWNLYDEACRYKRFLQRFAQVSEDRLSLIGILGYEQRVLRNGTSVAWNATEFNRLKTEAGRQG